ncbi:MAG: hypothetical protein HOL85_21645 [Rhodospirillaceae bacterium]|nr:hypothetical protein [Rhodospirillaceae bacterium]
MVEEDRFDNRAKHDEFTCPKWAAERNPVIGEPSQCVERMAENIGTDTASRRLAVNVNCAANGCEIKVPELGIGASKHHACIEEIICYQSWSGKC